MSRRHVARRGFNLVEILITLTLVALLTTSLINFVNDFDDKTKVARARSDLARIAQQSVLAESRSGLKMTTDSIGMTGMVTMLADYLVELPSYDPWGNRYWVSEDGTVNTSQTQGVAYLIDPAFGRIISAGPDGIVNTDIGSGTSDTDNDIVVEFRRQPWVAYSFRPNGGAVGAIYVARIDGTNNQQVMPNPAADPLQGVDPATGVANVTFSPNGARFCGVGEGGAGAGNIVCGNTSPQNPNAFAMGNSANVSNATFPLFTPDGNQVLWIGNDRTLRIGSLLTKQSSVLLPDGMNLDSPVAYTDTRGRLLQVTKQRSVYWRINGGANISIGIAASSDGKIAVGWYPTTPVGAKQGIFLVLPGSDTRRLLKEKSPVPPSGFIDWLPVGWEDTNDLLYWGKKSGGKNILRRIAQDGRFDIPLFNPDTQAVTGGDPVIPTLSPDGHLLIFIHGTNGKVLRTDGGGFLKGTDSASSDFLSLLPVRFSPFLWSKENDRAYYSAEHAGQSGIREVDFKLKFPTEPIEDILPQYNQVFPVTPVRTALGPNGLLVAAISSPSHSPNQEGVWVFPLLGPNGSYIEVSDSAFAMDPGNANLPNVVWIED